MTESVLVVKTSLLSPILEERGLITSKNEQFLEIALENLEFLPRPEAERNPDYKQIIPYVLLSRGDELFAMRRLSKGGESRLHGLISLGVGGHVNPGEDGNGENILIQGMLREISEEVEIASPGSLSPIGLINDDTTEVGKVHLGLVYIMHITGEVQVRETEKLEGFWMSISEAKRLKSQMESWSAIALEAIEPAGA